MTFPMMWSLNQALVWIALRHNDGIDRIRGASVEGRSSGSAELALILSPGGNILAAEELETILISFWRQLWRCIRSGHISAFGCRTGSNYAEPLLSSSFVGATFNIVSPSLGLQPVAMGWWTLLFDPDEIKAAFPEETPRARKGRPFGYKWPDLEEWAYQRLCDEGGYRPGWREAQLVIEVATHFGERWPSIPAESNIRTHLKSSQGRYEKDYRQ